MAAPQSLLAMIGTVQMPTLDAERVDRHSRYNVAPSALGGAILQATTDTTRRDDQRARPSDQAWEEVKDEMQNRYLNSKRYLKDIMLDMNKTFGLNATMPQYKAQIQKWGWCRNLSHDVAVDMNKIAISREVEEGKATVFFYGGKQWTAASVAQRAKRRRSAKRPRQATDDQDIAPPSRFTFKTPEPETSVPSQSATQHFTFQTPANVQGCARAATSPDTKSWAAEDQVQQRRKPRPTHQSMTVVQLAELLETARLELRQGPMNASHAERDLVHVWDGYKAFHGPVHGETTKVAYFLASFYVEQQRVNSSLSVLDTTTQAHVDELGVDHHRTRQHILEVARLLNSFGLKPRALAFLASATSITTSAARSAQCRRSRRNDVFSSAGQDLPSFGVDLSRPQAYTGAHGASIPDLFHKSTEHADAPEISPLEADPLYLNAILHLSEGETDRWAKTRIQALTVVLKQRQNPVTSAERRRAAVAYTQVLTAFPWKRNKVDDFELMEALLSLSIALLDAGGGAKALDQFDRTLCKADNIFGHDDERTIWMAINVGLVYQKRQGWNSAAKWFDRAYAGAIHGLGDGDGITIALEHARQRGYFTYLTDEGQPFSSVFGVDGITIRPGRVHLA